MRAGKQKYCSYCGANQERFHSVESVAGILDCSVETVRGWIKDRSIGSVKIGGLRRIPATELKKMTINWPSLGEVAENAVR